MRSYKFIFISVFLLFGFEMSAQPISNNYKLIVFEGSDWCINCIRLEKKILSNIIFTNYITSKNITIERIDFPQRRKLDKSLKDYNSSMAKKYTFNGTFPTILLIRSNSNSVFEIRYTNQSTDEFIKLIKSKISSLK